MRAVVWGLNALYPACRPNPSGITVERPRPFSGRAQGLAQFIPATASWIAGIYPDQLETISHYPSWAMRALVRVQPLALAAYPGPSASDCDRMAHDGVISTDNLSIRVSGNQRWLCFSQPNTRTSFRGSRRLHAVPGLNQW